MIAEARRFIAFLAVGGVNTLFGYAAFAALLFSGLVPTVAVIGSTIAGLMFNFLSFGSLFGSHAPYRLPRYLLVYALLLILNIVVLQFLLRAQIPALIGQGIAVALLSPLSFLAMRRYVFAGVS